MMHWSSWGNSRRWRPEDVAGLAVECCLAGAMGVTAGRHVLTPVSIFSSRDGDEVIVKYQF